MAPIVAVAYIKVTHSILFGERIATLSPADGKRFVSDFGNA